jgi:hypothetical protein
VGAARTVQFATGAPGPETGYLAAVNIPALPILCLLVACVPPTEEDPTPDDRPRDAQGCLIAASGGNGGIAGRQWIPDPILSTPEDDIPDYTILAWGPPGIEQQTEPVPLTVFVSRTLPDDEAGLLAILEGELALGQLALDTGWVVAVAIPGSYEGNLPQADDLGLNIGTQQDDAFFIRSLDRLEEAFNINRSRVHIFGSHGSGMWATHYAYYWGDRITTTANQAGDNPFDPWPPAWLRPVPFMAIRDPLDPIFPIAAMEDSSAMFEDAGAAVERFYDYDGSAGRTPHEFVSAAIFPRLTAFQARHCLEDQWL